jgi:post-segregation antitoxin (ccd killing protein)
MTRVNAYLPDDLASAARAAGLNVSGLTRQAIENALARRSTDDWLDSLGSGESDVTRDEVLAALDAARDELGD